MEFIKLGNYINHFDLCLRQERTGPAAEFAQKLGISERTLRNHLQQLRDLGVGIEFDYYRKTYKYTQKGRLKFGFDAEEMKLIKGGKLYNMLHTCDILANPVI
jgi:biotin operon repressor